jgi:hypothetical protein
MCGLMSLNFFADSLIAFKVLLLTGIGAEGIVLLKLAFKDSRPFWDSKEVNSGFFCDLAFSSPCIDCFYSSFSLVYIYMQYRLKYRQRNSWALDALVIIMSVYLTVGNIVSNLINGRNYSYQMLTGYSYGFIFLILCLIYD